MFETFQSMPVIQEYMNSKHAYTLFNSLFAMDKLNITYYFKIITLWKDYFLLSSKKPQYTLRHS